MTDEVAQSTGILRRIAAQMLGERRALGWIASAALLEAALALASPWITSRVIDTALPSGGTKTLEVLAALLVVVAAHGACLSWLHRRTALVAFQRLQARCLSDVLGRYLSTPFSRLGGADFGSTNEALNGAALILSACFGAFVELVTLGATGLAALGLLVSQQPWLAVSTLVCCLVVALFAGLSAFRESRHVEKVLCSSSESLQFLHVLLRAVPTLRASGATERLERAWVQRARTHALNVIGQENARLTRVGITQGGQQAASWFAMAWLVQATLSGEARLGDLVTCSMLVSTVLRVALGLAQTLVGLCLLASHVRRVDGLLAKAPERSPDLPLPAASRSARARLQVRIEDVWFRYPGSERWVLEGASYEFPGEGFTSFRGKSGFGKTTVLRLLAGLLEPERGKVSVLGSDPRTVRGLVAHLPQQAAPFEGSIASNLTLLSGATLERALEVADLTGLSEVVARMPMGVDTLLSAGGSNLSAGQRQLLTLTAALAKPHPVILLDEPTSQLDAAARARIRWPQLASGRAIICVHHT